MTVGEWRYFRLREIRAAKLWAASGGIAVHDNEGAFPFTAPRRGSVRARSYERTAHLLAVDAVALIAAAQSVGLKQAWIQDRGERNMHFDLFGSPLKLAIARCVDAPARWPAIPTDFDDRPDQGELPWQIFERAKIH